MRLVKLYFFTILTFSLFLTGCKSKKADDEIVVPAPNLYSNALKLLEENKYSKAAEEFGKIFFQHPGDAMTPQAELMQAYSLFLNTEYDEAVDVLDIFIKLHPMNVDIAYAHYLKALCYYMQISNVRLDQSSTSLAKESFEEIIKRFPNTKYATDSKLKIDLVNDHLAGKEMNVGRYYLQHKNPIAAINRFQTVVDNYQTTSHIQEALYRMTESYLLLGLIADAKKYTAVLGANYPDNKWYKYSYDLVNAASAKK